MELPGGVKLRPLMLVCYLVIVFGVMALVPNVIEMCIRDRHQKERVCQKIVETEAYDKKNNIFVCMLSGDLFACGMRGEVRTILEGETLLFCGSDIATALGYARPGKAIIDHCKGVLKRDTLTSCLLYTSPWQSAGTWVALTTRRRAAALPSAWHLTAIRSP